MLPISGTENNRSEYTSSYGGFYQIVREGLDNYVSRRVLSVKNNFKEVGVTFVLFLIKKFFQTKLFLRSFCKKIREKIKTVLYE